MAQVTGRKVATTPIVPTPSGGNVINSWNTSDNKETNAPSMKIVKDDLDAINDNLTTINNNLGAKNMLPNNATTQIINGITFTVNNDGSVTANGTASSVASLFLIGSTSAWGSNQYKNCILNGCPSGGSNDSYRIVMQTSSDGSAISKTYLEDGNGVLIDDDNQYCKIYIRIAGGYTANNLIFKPMVRPASIKDDTYAPYAQTNKELTANLNGFKFYPTGTQLVAYIEGHGWYNTDGKYVIWGTATANALVEASPNTYYGRPSEEDCRGEVGADTAIPFSGEPKVIPYSCHTTDGVTIDLGFVPKYLYFWHGDRGNFGIYINDGTYNLKRCVSYENNNIAFADNALTVNGTSITILPILSGYPSQYRYGDGFVVAFG